jgi:hypothetical protein
VTAPAPGYYPEQDEVPRCPHCGAQREEAQHHVIVRHLAWCPRGVQVAELLAGKRPWQLKPRK